MLNTRLQGHRPWFGALLALVLGAIAASGVLVYVRTYVISLRYELGRRVSHEHELSLVVERLRIEVAALGAGDEVGFVGRGECESFHTLFISPTCYRHVAGMSQFCNRENNYR